MEKLVILTVLLVIGYTEETFTKNGMKAVGSCTDDRDYWKREEKKCLQKESENMHFHCLPAVQSGIRYVEMCRQSILVPKGNHPVYNEAKDMIEFIPCSSNTFQDYDEYSHAEFFYKCLNDKTDFYSEGQLQCGESSTIEDRMFTCDHKNYYRFEDTRMSGCYPGLGVECIYVPQSECDRITHEITTDNRCVEKANVQKEAVTRKSKKDNSENVSNKCAKISYRNASGIIISSLIYALLYMQIME